MKALPVEPTTAPLGIGRRLRAVREKRRISLQQVVDAAGVSKGYLSRVERDLTTPSLPTLMALCQVLEVSPGEILDPPGVTVVRAAQAPPIALGGEGITERLVSPPGLPGLKVLRGEIAPGGHGESELYTVDCQVESLHVIEGALELLTVDGVLSLQAGDTATFAGQEPHSWSNPHDAPALVLWILSGTT